MFGGSGNLTLKVSCEVGGEGFECLTLVNDCKRNGKHKICETLFEFYDFGMWNDILVNDLGCRKGKYLG